MQIDNINKFNNLINNRNMKKVFFALMLLVGLTIKVNAQWAVTDASVAAQLALLNQSVERSNVVLTKMSATAAATKISTGASEGYMKAAQMALMVVDKALKIGMEINNILDRETRIVRKLKHIGNMVDRKKMGDRKFRRHTMEEFNRYLNITGSFVDLALSVLTDDLFKMETEQRREYLKEIDRNLQGVENSVDRLSYCISIATD